MLTVIMAYAFENKPICFIFTYQYSSVYVLESI